MKKLFICLATLALIAGLGAIKAEAATTGDVAITVTVQYIAVTVADGTIPFGPVTPGSDTVAVEKQVVTNTGNVNETYTLQLTTKDVYTVGETEIAAAADTFVLQALFTGSAGTAPVAGDFGADDGTADDVVKFSGAQTSSATVYAWLANTGDGISVPSTEVRDLYFKYSAPTSVTSGAEENLVVRLTATAAA